jgi:hypothetical protein
MYDIDLYNFAEELYLENIKFLGGFISEEIKVPETPDLIEIKEKDLEIKESIFRRILRYIIKYLDLNPHD